MQIETVPLSEALDSTFKKVNSISQSLSEENNPYCADLPLPEDTNLVSGFHLADSNKIMLELAGALEGADSLKWIFGSDAALIGLVLKDAAMQPVFFFANVNRNSRYCLEAQSAYLIDQFTKESVTEAFRFLAEKQNESVLDVQKRAIVQNMIKNTSLYNSGFSEENILELKRQNVNANFTDPSLVNKIRFCYDNISEGYDEDQNNVFSFLESYYLRQQTGLILDAPSKDVFLESFRKLAASDSPKLFHVMCSSFLFADRMTHLDFTPERIYSPDISASGIRAPAAAAFETIAEMQNISREHARKAAELDRIKDIKPHQITHVRGM